MCAEAGAARDDGGDEAGDGAVAEGGGAVRIRGQRESRCRWRNWSEKMCW